MQYTAADQQWLKCSLGFYQLFACYFTDIHYSPHLTTFFEWILLSLLPVETLLNPRSSWTDLTFWLYTIVVEVSGLYLHIVSRNISHVMWCQCFVAISSVLWSFDVFFVVTWISNWTNSRIVGGLRHPDDHAVTVRETNYLIEAERRIYAHKTSPSLVQIMACRLIGAKPLSEPMLDYCQLDPCEYISMKI